MYKKVFVEFLPGWKKWQELISLSACLVMKLHCARRKKVYAYIEYAHSKGKGKYPQFLVYYIFTLMTTMQEIIFQVSRNYRVKKGCWNLFHRPHIAISTKSLFLQVQTRECLLCGAKFSNLSPLGMPCPHE